MPERQSSLVGIGFGAASDRARENRLLSDARVERDLEREQRQKNFDAQLALSNAKLQSDAEGKDINRQLSEAKLTREQNKLAQEQEVAKIKQEVIAHQSAINNVDEFESFMKDFPTGLPLNAASPQIQKKALDLVSNLTQNEVGVLFFNDSVVPVEMDEEGNPIFLDVPTLAQSREEAATALARKKERLQILSPSDANSLFSTRKEATGTRLIFKDGTSDFIPFEQIKQTLRVDKDAFGLNRYFVEAIDADGSLTIKEVDPLELREQIRNLGNQEEIESLRSQFPSLFTDSSDIETPLVNEVQRDNPLGDDPLETARQFFLRQQQIENLPQDRRARSLSDIDKLLDSEL